MHAQAECKEGAVKVYNLLQRPTISNLVWQKLFSTLVAYDQQLQLCMDSSKTSPPFFQEGDARVVEAYLKVLKKVLVNSLLELYISRYVIFCHLEACRKTLCPTFCIDVFCSKFFLDLGDVTGD